MRLLRPAISLLLIFTLLLGFIYPVIITSISQLLFPRQANGSLIKINGQIIGSTLIGQNFTSAHYFWGRPSATPTHPYNTLASSGSNLGPSNPVLVTQIKIRIHKLQQNNHYLDRSIPIDLVTSSASGLDPDISVASAYYQAPRIAQARQLPLKTIEILITKHIKGRQLWIWGEPRINVLTLNLALDQLDKKPYGQNTAP